jgi:ribosomal protein S18 acetylase RimI-like enzyme
MLAIRPMIESDQAAVEKLATSTGLFAPGEWEAPDLQNLLPEHRWIVATHSENEVVGATYFAPEPVSHSLWNTYFLAVKKDSHRQGIGRQIMTHIEELAHLEGINTLIVETSSLESFSQARNFYLALGYVREAEIRDYYGPRENKIVFWKSLV